MKPASLSPLIFKVVQSEGAWSVEHEGHQSDRSMDKAEAVASATKRAREALAAGRPVQVRVEGETGYF
jgi:hypothetical protein